MPWAVCLPWGEAVALGRLRCVPRLTLCEQHGFVWLRGAADETLETQLRALPGVRRYEVLADDQLVLAGSHVPLGYLPAGPWTPLAEWFAVERGPALFAGTNPQRVPVRLVRDDQPREAGVLLTTLAEWEAYAAAAPQVRLTGCTFALSADGAVVVRGRPLPPVAGRFFVEQEGVAVPAGWRWEPAVDAAVLRRLCGLGPGDLALLDQDCSFDLVPAGQFVRAGRSAVRLSARGEGHG